MSDPERTICCVRNTVKKNLQEKALKRVRIGGEDRGSCEALHVAADLYPASGGGKLFEGDLRSDCDSSRFVSFELFG